MAKTQVYQSETDVPLNTICHQDGALNTMAIPIITPSSILKNLSANEKTGNICLNAPVLNDNLNLLSRTAVSSLPAEEARGSIFCGWEQDVYDRSDLNEEETAAVLEFSAHISDEITIGILGALVSPEEIGEIRNGSSSFSRENGISKEPSDEHSLPGHET